MRRSGRTFSAFLVLACLAGCSTTVSESQFDQYQAQLRTSPKLQRAELERCVLRLNAKPDVQRVNVATFINVPTARVGPVVCRRMIQAFVSGRIAYAEYKNLSKGLNVDQTTFIKVILGR